jgi:ribonucleoside-diphosphate reductase beta chain
MTSLTTPSIGYKPFRYPWAYDAWLQQQRIHWLPEEVPLADDVRDWQKRLEPSEKNLLTQIFRFFTQADASVAENYVHNYLPIFKPTEVVMMLSAFATSETTHVVSYSHLLDTVGMPESEYTTFMQIKEMRDKYDYFSSFSTDNPREVAKTLAAFGAFTEGLQLFASFAMLLNFPRFGKMKGMGQIIAWSVRDETLHCENIIRLFHTYCAENPNLFDDSLKAEIYEICKTIVEHEDAFIDLAFALGPVQGMTADEIKQYIRFIADRRLLQLRMAPVYKVKDNPLPWLDELLNAPEHTNFFENRATEYSKAATKGEWGDVF